jgi:hypothetical protein
MQEEPRRPKKQYFFIWRKGQILLRKPTEDHADSDPEWLNTDDVFRDGAYTDQEFIGCIDEHVRMAVSVPDDTSDDGWRTEYSNSDLIYCSKCGRYYNNPPGCRTHGGFN